MIISPSQIGGLQAELAGHEAATMHLSAMVDELRMMLARAMLVMGKTVSTLASAEPCAKPFMEHPNDQ